LNKTGVKITGDVVWSYVLKGGGAKRKS